MLYFFNVLTMICVCACIRLIQVSIRTTVGESAWVLGLKEQTYRTRDEKEKNERRGEREE